MTFSCEYTVTESQKVYSQGHATQTNLTSPAEPLPALIECSVGTIWSKLSRIPVELAQIQSSSSITQPVPFRLSLMKSRWQETKTWWPWHCETQCSMDILEFLSPKSCSEHALMSACQEETLVCTVPLCFPVTWYSYPFVHKKIFTASELYSRCPETCRNLQVNPVWIWKMDNLFCSGWSVPQVLEPLRKENQI